MNRTKNELLQSFITSIWMDHVRKIVVYNRNEQQTIIPGNILIAYEYMNAIKTRDTRIINHMNNAFGIIDYNFSNETYPTNTLKNRIKAQFKYGKSAHNKWILRHSAISTHKNKDMRNLDILLFILLRNKDNSLFKHPSIIRQFNTDRFPLDEDDKYFLLWSIIYNSVHTQNISIIIHLCEMYITYYKNVTFETRSIQGVMSRMMRIAASYNYYNVTKWFLTQPFLNEDYRYILPSEPEPRNWTCQYIELIQSGYYKEYIGELNRSQHLLLRTLLRK